MSAGTGTLDDVQASLVAQGIGQKTNSALDWMIYKGWFQDGLPLIADRAICLYELPGVPPLEAWAITYPGVQVAVRGKPDDYSEVRSKIQNIFDALHCNEPPLGGEFVFFYSRQSAPLSMGQDERRRPKLSWSFRSMRNTPTDASP